MIAQRGAVPIRIAAKVDRVDETYFHDAVEPLLSGQGVEFIGEISDRQKAEFLGNARALIFPIDWPEPFGLVMIEAMACGTPVLAFRRGAVPEIIDDGITGIIVETVDEAVAALPRVCALDRRRIRRTFEQRFGAARMAREYESLFLSMQEKAPAIVPARDEIAARDQSRDRLTMRTELDID